MAAIVTVPVRTAHRRLFLYFPVQPDGINQAKLLVESQLALFAYTHQQACDKVVVVLPGNLPCQFLNVRVQSLDPFGQFRRQIRLKLARPCPAIPALDDLAQDGRVLLQAGNHFFLTHSQGLRKVKFIRPLIKFVRRCVVLPGLADELDEAREGCIDKLLAVLDILLEARNFFCQLNRLVFPAGLFAGHSGQQLLAVTGQFGELCQWLQGHHRLLDRRADTIHCTRSKSAHALLEALEVLAAVDVDEG